MKTLSASVLKQMVAELTPAMPTPKSIAGSSGFASTGRPSPLAAAIQKGIDSDLPKLEEALAYVSPDALRGTGSIFNPDGTPSNEYWLGVIFAVRREFGPAGEDVVRNWSKQSPRYLDGSGFNKAWAGYDPSHPNPVTIGSVYKLAHCFGWQQANAPSMAPATSPPSSPNNDRFHLLDRNAIMAQPPLRWRIKYLLPETGIAALYGPSGSGKSYLGIDAGISIALVTLGSVTAFSLVL